MNFSHREEQRDNRLLDVFTDETSGLRVTVSRLGAELIGLSRRNAGGEWIGFLWRDNEIAPPARGWANHATVMGYYLHRLKNERAMYRGAEIRGGTHSFLRHKIWRLADCYTSLTYSVGPADYEAVEYPLRVSLDLIYSIENENVRVQFVFTNHEPELTAHVGFGLHPGFAATSFDSFRLHMPAGLYRRHFSPDNFLSGETEDIHFAGGEMPFDRAKLSGSYILELMDVPERRFVYSDPPSGRTVVLEMPETPYLTLWSDGNPFVCVEPCWGLTDHHNQRSFENKAGIQQIAAGDQLVRSFTISPRLESR